MCLSFPYTFPVLAGILTKNIRVTSWFNYGFKFHRAKDTHTHKTNEFLFIWKQLLEQTHQTNLFRICYWHSARTLWKMKEPLNAFLTPWVVAHHAISYNKKFPYAQLPVGVPFFRDTIKSWRKYKSWKHFRCGVTTVCIMHRVINQTSCNSCQKVLSRSGLLHIFRCYYS